MNFVFFRGQRMVSFLNVVQFKKKKIMDIYGVQDIEK